jgi:glycosyltransferase involved in cell wall biosynthesis
MTKNTKKTVSKRSKVVVVMPAYNAERTLKKTYNDIPKSIRKNVILVDDGSNDKTVLLAQKMGIKTIVHPQNRGYGGNQKTCYTNALSEGADVVVMIHPDYQYDATLTEEMVTPIINGRFDIMFGSRIRTRKEALEGGMPTYKYLFNRFLTIVENIILGQNLSEYHTGFRAFDRKVLKKVPFHKFSDDFVFDQDIVFSSIREGFRIGEIPVPVRYFPEASSINFRRSAKYGLEILLGLIKYVLDLTGVYSSAIFARSSK